MITIIWYLRFLFLHKNLLHPTYPLRYHNVIDSFAQWNNNLTFLTLSSALICLPFNTCLIFNIYCFVSHIHTKKCKYTIDIANWYRNVSKSYLPLHMVDFLTLFNVQCVLCMYVYKYKTQSWNVFALGMWRENSVGTQKKRRKV